MFQVHSKVILLYIYIYSINILFYSSHFYSSLIRDFFPGGSVVMNPPPKQGDSGSIPGLGRSSGEGNHNPLQFSCLGNHMERGVWWVIVHGVAKSWTQLSN